MTPVDRATIERVLRAHDAAEDDGAAGLAARVERAVRELARDPGCACPPENRDGHLPDCHLSGVSLCVRCGARFPPRERHWCPDTIPLPEFGHGPLVIEVDRFRVCAITDPVVPFREQLDMSLWVIRRQGRNGLEGWGVSDYPAGDRNWLSESGDWDWLPRDEPDHVWDAWIRTHRWPLGEALRRAQAAAPLLVLNGRNAAQVTAFYRELASRATQP